ncbi:MAG: hypothetical protein ABFD92_21065 [Planctomycetaceae bacterium]
MAHTTGPFTIEATHYGKQNQVKLEIMSPYGPVAHIYNGGLWDRARYVMPAADNAHLFAAALDLLEVAKMLASLESADGGRTFPTKEMCAAARAAIAKAVPQ